MDPATGVLRVAAGSPWRTTTGGAQRVVIRPGSRHAYVGLSGFTMDQETAGLTPLRGSPFQVGVSHVHPNGRCAYFVEGQQLRVVSLDPESGIPTPVPGGAQTLVGWRHTLAFDHEWRRGFLASAAANTLAVFDVDGENGLLRPVPGSPFRTGDYPCEVFLHPSGRFVYVANAKSNDVSGYQIDVETGRLRECPGSPYRGLDRDAHRAAASVSTHRFVYIANSESNNVAALRLDMERGELSGVPGAPFGVGKRPSGLAVDPQARFLLVSNAGSDNVSVLAIDRQTGGLTPVPGSPFKAGYAPSGVAIHPSGRFAYVANRASENVSAYRLQPDGALTRASRWPCVAGGQPLAISVHPSGRYAYAANLFSGIMGFAVDDASGELRALSEAPSGQGNFESIAWAGAQLVAVGQGEEMQFFSMDPTSGAVSATHRHHQIGPVVAIDRAGRFAYGSHRDGNEIRGEGAELVPIQGEEAIPGFHEGLVPQLVAIDPSDRYLIVTTFSGQVAVYPRDKTTGALTFRAYPAGIVSGYLSPSAIVITP
jgi:6-phosphogluconolactonase (cycloisomerase 2 family)